MTEKPCHIVARPGDGKAMCGSKDLPVIWQARIAMHESVREVDLCEECTVLADAVPFTASHSLLPPVGEDKWLPKRQASWEKAQEALTLAKAMDSSDKAVISNTTKPDTKGSTDMAHLAILQENTLIIRMPGQPALATVRLANPDDIDAVVAALVPYLPKGNGNGNSTNITYSSTNTRPAAAIAEAAIAIATAPAPKPAKVPKPKAADGEAPRKRGRAPAVALTVLIDWLDDRPGATAAEVAEAFDLTPVIASRVLTRAFEGGALVREGGGKRNDPYTYYTVDTEAEAVAG